jgi:hypothetical protein
MHAFCALITAPKLPFGQNVKAFAKSSHHENFAHDLTFGWFGNRFSVLSVQKSAVWADPISTFYKVDYCWSSLKSRTKPQHTTHNTQQPTKMSHRCPTSQRLCPLLPWQHPPWLQLLVQRLPTSPCKACTGGFGGALVVYLVWNADAYPIKKYSNGHGLGLKWPKLKRKTQQPTKCRH